MSSTEVDPSPSSPSLATRKRKVKKDGINFSVQDLMTEKGPQQTGSKMGERGSSEVVDHPSPSSLSLATKKMKVKEERSGSDHILTADEATATEQSCNSKLEKSKVPAIRKAEFSFTASRLKPSTVSSPMVGGVPIAAKKVNYPSPKYRFELSSVAYGTDSVLGSIDVIEAARASQNQPLPSLSAFGPSFISNADPVPTFAQYRLHGKAEEGSPNQCDFGSEAKEPVVLDNGEGKFCSFLPVPNVFEVDKGAPIFRVPDSVGSNEGTEVVNTETLNEYAHDSEEANAPKRTNHDDDLNENNHVEEGQTNRVRIGGMVVYRWVKKDGDEKGKFEKQGTGILELNDEMNGIERTFSTISVRAGTNVFLNSYVVPGSTIKKKKGSASIVLSAQDGEGNLQTFALKATSDEQFEEILKLVAALEVRTKE